MLQEPDFAQSLLRDPNTPIIRKSRGTSTQGTSTHASSTQLAVLDEQRSKAGSVHSKVSSYHGSLHRSRDGRYGHGSDRRPGCPGGEMENTSCPGLGQMVPALCR